MGNVFRRCRMSSDPEGQVFCYDGERGRIEHLVDDSCPICEGMDEESLKPMPTLSNESISFTDLFPYAGLLDLTPGGRSTRRGID